MPDTTDASAQAQVRRWRPGRPVDVLRTLGPLVRGNGDPTHRRDGAGGLWRAARTPQGAVLLHLSPRARDGEVHATAWGPGAQWALEQVPELLGDGDDDTGFAPNHAVLARSLTAHPGWRVPRSRGVWEALLGAALEQRVTGVEAHRAWRGLVLQYGEPAPGPARLPGNQVTGMRTAPAPEAVARVPSWQWLQWGVDLHRRRPLVDAVHRAVALERTLELSHEEAATALRSVVGVGVWTAAEIRHRAHGDPDAFSWQDYHVATHVCWALTGEVGDDARCAELIEEYRGHRYRVQRLVELAGIAPPRRGPRRSLPTHLPSPRR
ncbi:MAG: DNA-3-methyladenine glycosylase 2 family protein [Kineosporiaceae bacterium]